ncbi:uncharacterized protein LOC143174196 [Nomia melanderi]|uniref:uncharacterized protein LOC143174196 n=1 Tax=Nomia melanderi TaxID=2448451 RepID=UPI003FCD60B2
MEFSKSQKGNNTVAYKGFEYLQFWPGNDVITWRCRKNRALKCHSLLKTKNGKIVEGPTAHCHDSCPQIVQANIAKFKMREEIQAVGATPRNVFGNILSHLSDEVVVHMPKNLSVTWTLNNQKRKDHIPNSTPADFAIPEEYTQFILHDTSRDDPDRILAFENINVLNELKKPMIFSNRTFDKVPNMFYQLYTRHAQIENLYLSCIYFLLQQKNSDTYFRMLEIL